jgi:hypothetical protein
VVAAQQHPFLSGLGALLHLARRTDAQVSATYMKQVEAVCKRVWDSRWPEINREIVSVTTREELDQVLAEGASDIWGSPLTDEDEDDLITTVVKDYDHGVRMGMRPPKKRSRQRFRVVRATLDPADQLERVMEKAMTVRDRKAIEWLASDTLFWVGDQWNQGIGKQISNAAVKAFEKGERRGELAKELSKSMARFNRPDSYWRVVSSAAVVRGRSMGQISGMRGAGTTSMEFIAMMDERTSPLCQDMNGRVFTIEQATSFVDNVTDTDSPDAMKEAWPWARPSDVIGKSNDDLAAMGVIAPPLHGR